MVISNNIVKKIFYDFLHVNVIPTVSFEEATSKEVIQMTPFITEEEEKEIRPSIPTCEVGRWFPAFADITANSEMEEMISLCFATQLSELLWDRLRKT